MANRNSKKATFQEATAVQNFMTNLLASAKSGKTGRVVGFLAISFSALLLAPSLLAQVPAVVVSSQVNLTPSNNSGAGQTVVDSCGDVYVNLANGGGVIEINASSGAISVVTTNTNNYDNGKGLAIDPAKQNLYFPTNSQWYSSSFSKVPLNGCVPGNPVTVANNFNTIGNYYYGTAGAIAVDAAGDIFFTPTCCSTGTILEESAGNVPATLQANWPNNIIGMASDAAGDVYFADGSANVYVLKPPYTAAAATFVGGFGSTVGVTFDNQGNLYVADNTNNAVYEIPSVSGVLTAADKFEVVAGVPVDFSIGIDNSQNLYVSNYSGDTLEERLGSVSLPATVVGQASATASLNLVFNAAVSPSSIVVNSGTAASTYFSAGAGCSISSSYTAGSTCSTPITYTPTEVGQQVGAYLLSDGSGNLLVNAGVSGVGLGPEVTVDPGTINPEAPTPPLATPKGAAIDAQGNVYVADAGASAIIVFPAGGGASTVASAGSAITLNAPTGVAVDGAGDLYIADTGDNRIVEIPVIGGVLSPTSAGVVNVPVKAPQGIAVDGDGALYIADTGNGRVVYVPNDGSGLNYAEVQYFTSGLSAPAAVAVDAVGNVYIADSANNDVVKYTGPIGSSSGTAVITGLNAPSGVATDPSGSVFVVDSGSTNVYRYPSVNGLLGSRTLVGNGISNPFGITIDTSGNLYVTDNVNALVDQVARVQTDLNFGALNVATTSSPLTADVNNSGNQTVTFQNPSYSISGNTSAGFTITQDGCGTAGTVAAGAHCGITATFTPPTTELNAEEDLTLLSNTAVGAPSIALIGTGANIQPSTLSVVLTAPAAGTPLTVVTPVTFTATVNTEGDTIPPGGRVQFLVNGNPVGTVTVSNSAASITLANGLPGGNDTITANYTGDEINYAGSSASINETVGTLPSTLALALATPYINPYSANDYAGNAQGPSITLTAAVGVDSNRIPGGMVSFYSGTTSNATLLGTASVISGSASVVTTALRAGSSTLVENNSYISTYSLFAVYTGDPNYSGATSNTEQVSIVAPSVEPTGTCVINPTGSQTACPPSESGATYSYTLSSNTITVPSPLTGEGSGSVVVTFTSYGGWAGILNFTCSGLPIYASCQPYPGYPQINANTHASNTGQTQVQFFIKTDVPPLKTSSMVWWLACPLGFVLLVMRRRLRQHGWSSASMMLGLVLLLGGSLAGLSGCGNSIKPIYNTPAGTSTINVQIEAAQFVPGAYPATTTGTADVNPGSFQLNLVVQ